MMQYRSWRYLIEMIYRISQWISVSTDSCSLAYESKHLSWNDSSDITIDASWREAWYTKYNTWQEQLRVLKISEESWEYDVNESLKVFLGYDRILKIDYMFSMFYTTFITSSNIQKKGWLFLCLSISIGIIEKIFEPHILL